MGTFSRLLAVTKNVPLNWSRVSPARQRQIAGYLDESYTWHSETELPSTFEELMGVFNESKSAGYFVPPLTDYLTGFLPAFSERVCAMFDLEGEPHAVIFDPAAPTYQPMDAVTAWGGIDCDMYLRLEEGETEEELMKEAQEDDDYAIQRATATIAFRNNVMRPFLQLSPSDDPVLFLRQHGFRYHEQMSAREDAMWRRLNTAHWGSI